MGQILGQRQQPILEGRPMLTPGTRQSFAQYLRRYRKHLISTDSQ